MEFTSTFPSSLWESGKTLDWQVGLLSVSVSVTCPARQPAAPPVIRLEFILRLKIPDSVWLRADRLASLSSHKPDYRFLTVVQSAVMRVNELVCKFLFCFFSGNFFEFIAEKQFCFYTLILSLKLNNGFDSQLNLKIGKHLLEQ